MDSIIHIAHGHQNASCISLNSVCLTGLEECGKLIAMCNFLFIMEKNGNFPTEDLKNDMIHIPLGISMGLRLYSCLLFSQ